MKERHVRVSGNDTHCRHPSSSTYINEIRQVMNIILEYRCIGGFQSQQILVSCLNGLQSVFCVLCLALEENHKQNRGYKEVQQE